VNAANAALITGLGALLGLAAGVGPAAGYVGYSVSVGWRVPWAALLGIVVVPPVLAVAVAAVLLTPRDRPLRLTLRGSAGPPAPAGGLRFPAAGRAW
jgi:putative ABC transport system permease protein